MSQHLLYFIHNNITQVVRLCATARLGAADMWDFLPNLQLAAFFCRHYALNWPIILGEGQDFFQFKLKKQLKTLRSIREDTVQLCRVTTAYTLSQNTYQASIKSNCICSFFQLVHRAWCILHMTECNWDVSCIMIFDFHLPSLLSLRFLIIRIQKVIIYTEFKLLPIRISEVTWSTVEL